MHYSEVALSTTLNVSLQMSEMNKTHFEQTLLAIHEQQADEIRAAVESRDKQYAEGKSQYTSEVEMLRVEIQKLKMELNDEKAEKETAFARLAVSCSIDRGFVGRVKVEACDRRNCAFLLHHLEVRSPALRLWQDFMKRITPR